MLTQGRPQTLTLRSSVHSTTTLTPETSKKNTNLPSQINYQTQYLAYPFYLPSNNAFNLDFHIYFLVYLWSIDQKKNHQTPRKTQNSMKFRSYTPSIWISDSPLTPNVTQCKTTNPKLDYLNFYLPYVEKIFIRCK